MLVITKSTMSLIFCKFTGTWYANGRTLLQVYRYRYWNLQIYYTKIFITFKMMIKIFLEREISRTYIFIYFIYVSNGIKFYLNFFHQTFQQSRKSLLYLQSNHREYIVIKMLGIHSGLGDNIKIQRDNALLCEGSVTRMGWGKINFAKFTHHLYTTHDTRRYIRVRG